MKTDIHPKYYQAKVTCSCGNEFVVGATVESMRVEICSVCHPFYTGNMKLVDTAGRVEKFQERLSKVQASPKKKAAAKVAAATTESNKDRLKAMKQSLTEEK